MDCGVDDKICGSLTFKLIKGGEKTSSPAGGDANMPHADRMEANSLTFFAGIVSFEPVNQAGRGHSFETVDSGRLGLGAAL